MGVQTGVGAGTRRCRPPATAYPALRGCWHHGRHPAWPTRLLLEPSSLRPEISRDVPVQPTVEVAIRRRG